MHFTSGFCFICDLLKSIDTGNGIIYNTFIMKIPQIVIDTNVIFSALYSRRGASFKLLSLIGKGKFKYAISVPLIFEYEDVAMRKNKGLSLTVGTINKILDRLCHFADKREIFYLWRPYLHDPKDDLILELAVEARCSSIITYNKKDFKGINKFGIDTLTPKEFLQKIGEIS